MNEVLRIYVDALYLSRRQTAGVAEATLRMVDDERTAQTREDGVLNESVVPLFSRRTIIEFYPLFPGAIASACHPRAAQSYMHKRPLRGHCASPLQ